MGNVTQESLKIMFEIDPIIFTLSNGIKVAYLRREAFVAHLGVMIYAGSRFEHENEQGLAHFIEHCIFKGTKKRKALDIFSDLDCVGGELNAYTNKEEIGVHASFRKTHFEIASELLGDIVQNATFPEDEMVREKEVILDEIMSYLDSPMDRIQDDFEAHLFKGNSLGYNILGSKKSVSGFTRDDIMKYVERLFTPENMVISFVGDLSIDQLRDSLEKHFGGISRSGETVQLNTILENPTFKIREKKSNYQVHTILGGIAPSFNDDSRRAMTLATNLLGGPALNSRLILSIREKHGYAYNVEASYTPYSDLGFWNIYLGTDKKYLKKAINLIHDELKIISDNPLSAQDIAGAKEQLKGHLALALDSNLELMFNMGKSILVFGKIDPMSEVYRHIDEVSTEQVQQIARTYFAPERISELIFEF
ncbi:MAG: putative Zn-dependent peptidase [Crocinitomicaceae bacterium]|jgi:predicted Zn-dependent peptidase